MNKKIIKFAVLALLLLSMTGCTKILKDKNNKVVKYDS